MFGARFRRFWNRPRSIKLALLQAALFLSFAQLLIKLVPYPWWSKMLGPISPAYEDSPAPVENEAVRTVASVIHTVARHLPWEVVCLPRAMVAKWMLSRRRIPNTLFLGVRRSPDPDVKEPDLHAWLRVGNQTITGGDVADQFKVIARFGAEQSTKHSRPLEAPGE